MSQDIMVVPIEKLWTAGYFQGFVERGAGVWEQNIQEHRKKYPRDKAEQDLHYKQPITYAIIRHSITQKIAHYTRDITGNEARLHTMHSLGIGGHIDIHTDEYDKGASRSPSYLRTLWTKHLYREIQEEIGLQPHQYTATHIGYINDDQTTVGKFHIGIAYIVDITEDITIQSQEEAIAQFRWSTERELEKHMQTHQRESRSTLLRQAYMHLSA